MPNIARFALGLSKGICSEVWTVWANGSDVYLTCTGMSGQSKISLHESGICRYAHLKSFFESNKIKFGRQDRVSLKWRRPPTPEEGAVHATELIFAAYNSWEPFWQYEKKKRLQRLLPPPRGIGLRVSIVFSKQDPDVYCSDPRVARFRLPSEEYVTLIFAYFDLPNDFFEIGALPNVPILSSSFSLEKEVDVRNVAVMYPGLIEPDGPLQVLSLHNVRFRKITTGSKRSYVVEGKDC